MEPSVAVIDGLLDDAGRGESGPLVIRAGAGPGKTALLDYAAMLAAGMKVPTATGVEAQADFDDAGLHSADR
ncbi:MAG: hypothetical protein ACRDPA_24345 [Solirubrobacteraceae bacterium]